MSNEKVKIGERLSPPHIKNAINVLVEACQNYKGLPGACELVTALATSPHTHFASSPEDFASFQLMIE